MIMSGSIPRNDLDPDSGPVCDSYWAMLMIKRKSYSKSAGTSAPDLASYPGIIMDPELCQRSIPGIVPESVLRSVQDRIITVS